MTLEEIAELAKLAELATPGPWFVEHLNDDLAISGVVVSSGHLLGKTRSYGNWHSDEIVAGCLIQSSGCVSAADGRWDANAELIAATRNALPDLIKLARLALQQGDTA